MKQNNDNDFRISVQLKKLRTKNGITQEQLSKITGYSVRQIQRFESVDNSLADEAITTLSDYYNYDIRNFIDIIASFENADDYIAYKNLHIEIENDNCIRIREIADKLRSNASFMKDEKRYILYFCDAFVISKLEKDYELSCKLCVELLELLGINNYINALQTRIQKKIVYTIILLLIFNYRNSGQKQLFSELVNAFNDHFEELVYDSPYPVDKNMYDMNKHYVAAKNWLAVLYLDDSQYDAALRVIDNAIELTNQFRVTTYLQNLLLTKSVIFYNLGDIAGAKKLFNSFKEICEVRNCHDYYISIESEFRTKYAQLFD